MCKCNRTGLFLHGGALGGAVVVVGSATQIGLLTHLHRPSPPRRRRRLRCRPRITRRRLSASTPLVTTYRISLSDGATRALLHRDVPRGPTCRGRPLRRRRASSPGSGPRRAERRRSSDEVGAPIDARRRAARPPRWREHPASSPRGRRARGGGAGRRWWRGSPMLLCESKKSQSAERSGGRRRRGAQTAHVGRLPRSGFFRGRRRASRSVPAGFWGLRAGCRASSGELFARRQTRPYGPPAAPNPQISF